MFVKVDEEIQRVVSKGKYGPIIPTVVSGLGIFLFFVLPVVWFWASYLGFAVLASDSISEDWSSTIIITVPDVVEPSLAGWSLVWFWHIAAICSMLKVISRHVGKVSYRHDSALNRVTSLLIGAIGGNIFSVNHEFFWAAVCCGLIMYAMGSYMWETHTKEQ